ncbi:glutathione S-transferase C-terminal-like protein [Meira miltonrushii]|uniref:Glutathione S-transferase C-terminal-like protein n=1 Tax=Meira miltonrushii TaxID=1280837 RepID=A0A316VRI4_9BASI|nr:glutathione S-transferase C-terminal-like protein [Meira miltonrushii]PWN38105.1 glutathione S-transferase C-terminal-like protein [Meira miltonrushii]
MSQAIKLYTAATPNGFKVSNLLEELKAIYKGLDYETHKIEFSKNEQKSDWFLKICPNGRIPAIVDPNRGSGDGFNVFETAAITIYLQENYDPENHFNFSKNEKDGDLYRSEVLQWIFFIHGGIGPMMGQANHFNHYAPEKIPYGQERYTNESARLFAVLEERLKDRDWLVGPGRGKYTIADMNGFPWVMMGRHSGVPDAKIGPNVQAWIERQWNRDAIQKEMLKPGYAEKHGKTIAEKSQQNAKWIREGNAQNKI